MISRSINKVYWHCSASDFGTNLDISWWHSLRGFASSFRGQYQVSTGYHFIILSRNTSAGEGEELDCLDGSIEVGRRLEQVGAGVKGDNRNSVHICLIGVKDFSDKQIQSALRLTMELMVKFGIPVDRVLGHYEWWSRQNLTPKKSCPNIDMDVIRQRLAAMIAKKSS